MSMSDHQFNYVTANRFYVEMDSEIKAYFSECSGLGVKIQYESYIEGGVNDQKRVILGDPDFTDVTLKRGMTDNMDFWDWLNDVLSSKSNKRRNVNILLFNQAGETMQSWTLVGAVPVGWQPDSLQASSESVALESLTLAYERLQIGSGSQGSGAQKLSQGRGSDGSF